MSSVRPSNSGCTWIVGGALLRYLRALPTIRVHSELDGRTLDIVHSLITLRYRVSYQGGLKSVPKWIVGSIVN